MWTKLLEYIHDTNQKLGHDKVRTLESLRYVMAVLKEVRERESNIEMEINPILDMFNMLEQYLLQDSLSVDDMDKRSSLEAFLEKKLADFC